MKQKPCIICVKLKYFFLNAVAYCSKMTFQEICYLKTVEM